MKKRIIFLVIALAIVSMFIISCDGNTIFGNQGNGTIPSTYSYLIKPNIEEAYGGRDLPALPIGTEIFLIGKIFAFNPDTGSMQHLQDNIPTDIIRIGIIDSVNVIQAAVLLNLGQEYGVNFLAKTPDGDFQELNVVPEIYVFDDVDTTIVVLNELYQAKSFSGAFPHGFPKAYPYYHGFEVNNDGSISTIGNFLVDDLQEMIFTWDGEANWTSNLAGTEIIPVPDSLAGFFTEPIDENMDIKIKYSNIYLFETSMTWNPDSLYFERTIMVAPGSDCLPFYQNLLIYEAQTQGAPKIFGINAGSTELMNVYQYYTEFLFLFKVTNGIPENVQTLDLRGILAIIYP